VNFFYIIYFYVISLVQKLMIRHLYCKMPYRGEAGLVKYRGQSDSDFTGHVMKYSLNFYYG
jgi:hypothetical protein